ncbi:MAG: prolyl oligopeptidase family serine peptidase [Thermaerobacter sp.]|nr:prolyl oligopeptidase family serine peptidase [Thermaerobacter sp.]
MAPNRLNGRDFELYAGYLDGRALAPVLIDHPPNAGACGRRRPSRGGGPCTVAPSRRRGRSLVRLQYWLSVGVAVLAPNVRGSTGCGRRHEPLDDGALRADAIRDLDASRIVVFGGSYGGYMVRSTALFAKSW